MLDKTNRPSKRKHDLLRDTAPLPTPTAPAADFLEVWAPAEPKRESVTGKKTIVITPPNFQTATITIRGTAPYVQNRMSQRAREAMEEAQKAGSQARRKNRKKEPKDFDAAFHGAMHVSTEGWCGIPCSGLRAALISACRTVDFAMTRAKLFLFVVADGYDRDDGQGLVKITGEAFPFNMAVRLASGVADIACRPRFDPGWTADITLKWDADAFTATDIMNLVARAGIHVGIGAGRPDSKESCGIGFGTFEVIS
jgi:hypothetical protein